MRSPLLREWQTALLWTTPLTVLSRTSVVKRIVGEVAEGGENAFWRAAFKDDESLACSGRRRQGDPDLEARTRTIFGTRVVTPGGADIVIDDRGDR